MPMDAIDRFSTDRLLTERLRATDFSELCRMNQDPIVMATLGGVRSDEAARKYVRDNLKHWELHGYGLWILRRKADGQFIGRSALRNAHIDGNSEVELGYALMAEHWGVGFATEITKEMLKVAFTHLDLADVVAFMLPSNQASRRVIEKVGGSYERDIVRTELPHVLYRIRRDSYASE